LPFRGSAANPSDVFATHGHTQSAPKGESENFVGARMTNDESNSLKMHSKRRADTAALCIFDIFATSGSLELELIQLMRILFDAVNRP
jgi:hypothetical protein